MAIMNYALCMTGHTVSVVHNNIPTFSVKHYQEKEKLKQRH